MPLNKPITLKKNGNQYDTIEFMKKIAYQNANEPFFKNYIKKNNLVGSPSDLSKIFHDIFYKTNYKKDPEGIQQIRTGTRLLKEGIGNCVDYSVIFSSFLLNLGIPHKFRMISTDRNRPNAFSHIYLVTDSGIVMDAVIGQDQNGFEYKKKKNQRTPFFNTEANYVKKFDLKVL